MELIKVTNPDTSLMESALTEEQCDELFEKIKVCAESGDYSVLREEELPLVPMIIVGGAAVLGMISALRNWIKGKYSLRVKRIYDQSKELNDIYTKVSELLAHDKMARFKHRNDRMDADVESCVLKDKKDPRKAYKFTIDFIGYDADYFIKEIDEIMRYVNTESKKKDRDLKNMTDSLIEEIDKNFEKNHWFIRDLTPFLKVTHYTNQKLEDILMCYKDSIGNIYNIIYVYNKYIAGELQYLQTIEIAYKQMLKKYEKDKGGKLLVDSIFKKLIKNMTMSMEFNTKSMDIFEEIIKFYVEQLEKLYDHIRS